MAARYEIALLGPTEVRRDDVELDLRSPLRRALLVALAVREGRVVPADLLIDVLWRGRAGPGAAGRLHALMARLRRELGGSSAESVVVTRPPGYRLTVRLVEVDIDGFERLVREGTGAADLLGGVVTLERALSMWRGPPLCDAGDDPVARVRAEELLAVRLQAVEELVWRSLELAEPARALVPLGEARSDSPLHERLAALHALALGRAGRRADALWTIHRFRDEFSSATGLEPGPEITALERTLLDGAPLSGPGRGGS